ncbi:uncharacterized protein LOC119668470 isoform X2 [Teleopsis dalmanni]|uniref:uncharacterized protein LOC119668470 isoform X2 n=1 Tax=Teleopsis dalmanni TaxID=139649 RepID=UPI0018CC9BA8|nr:uncharacterized protein LOC119668470 isoform X2 [Teleopsis dalmanni]
MRYFDHIIRGAKYELLQLIVEGRIERKRGMELCTFSVKTDDETLDTMLSSTSSEQKIVCTNSSSTQTDNAAGSQINHSTEVDLYMQCAAQQLKTFPELDAWAIIVNIQQTINEKRLEIMNRPNKRTLISATISSSRSQTPTLPYDST